MRGTSSDRPELSPIIDKGRSSLPKRFDQSINNIPKPQGILKPVQPPNNRNTNFDQHINANDLASAFAGFQNNSNNNNNAFFSEGSPMKSGGNYSGNNYLSPPNDGYISAAQSDAGSTRTRLSNL
jgi:hypothetical protein